MWKLQTFTATVYSQKFRQINVLLKNFCKLIWRKNICVAENFVFFHTVYTKFFVKSNAEVICTFVTESCFFPWNWFSTYFVITRLHEFFQSSRSMIFYNVIFTIFFREVLLFADSLLTYCLLLESETPRLHLLFLVI